MKTRIIPGFNRSRFDSQRPNTEPDHDRAVNLEIEENDDEESHEQVIARKNTIAGWKIFTGGLLGVNALLSMIMITMLSTALSKSMPTLITRGNGETETLEFFTGTDRSPALIKFYAEKVMSGIYTWRNTLPEKDNPPDPGISVEGGKKIPTTAFRYTLALEPEFANSYRKQLAELILIVQGQNPETQTVYVPLQIGQPEPFGTGRWKIKVTGTQLIVNGKNQAPKKLPINVEMVLRAVSPPILSEMTRKYPDIGIAKAAQMARAEGLEVESIVNIK